MKKAIITVVGKDTVGIIGKVCTFLAEKNVNIMDITQTIVDEYFNMMMVVNMQNAAFDDVSDGLNALGGQIGVVIHCQREDIFNQMHRI